MKVRISAVLLWLFATASSAAGLCDGAPCSIALDFASGGSIAAPQGATLAFGPGGSLVLGTDGVITLGEGGSITPENADMSSGGSIVLGPGGGIQFGEGGALATGEQGGIEVPTDGSFDVDSVTSVAVQSEHSVHLGTLHTEGSIEMTAYGNMRDADASTPIHFTTPAGNAEATIRVTSGGDLTWKNIQGPPESITLTAGTIEVTDEGNDWGTYQGGDSGPTESCDSAQSGSVQFSSSNSGSYYSCSYSQSIDGSLELSELTLMGPFAPAQRGGGGAFGLSGSLLGLWLGLSGLGRRRR